MGAGGALAQPAALTGEQLYRAVNGAVYLVVVASSFDDIKNKRDLRQGSAVAIGDRELITNCKLIKDRSVILLIDGGGQIGLAAVRSANHDSDRCTLAPLGPAVTPVRQIRPYASLAVGERVYTIGSPKGLKNTLGETLVTGLRKYGALRVIQIEAPAIAGSAGGAVFDRFGNLVGVINFLYQDAPSINFAVAIEDYADVARLPQPSGDPPSVAPAVVPRPPAALSSLDTTGRTISLQLAVAQSDRQARDAWAYIKERFGDVLGKLEPSTQAYDTPDKKTFVRLLAGPIASTQLGLQLCQQLTQRGHAACSVFLSPRKDAGARPPG